MDDKLLKHLEFVQNTINRMSTNSFLIKGWAITLIGIIFGLNKLEGNYLFEYSNYNFPVETAIIILIVLLFWFTNAYFLQQERRYIFIYSKTIEKFNLPASNNTVATLTLDMNYKNYIAPSNSNLTDKKRNIILIAIILICIIGIGISLLYFESTFQKIIIPFILILISTFIATYFILIKHLCEFWTCFIGRTIMSVYGILIMIVLLLNHSMFNTVLKKDIGKERCECAIKIDK
jgi:hypothetical protein